MSRYLMGANSPAGSDTNTSESGIVEGHAYSVLDARDVEGNQLIQLRNPWGDTGEIFVVSVCATCGGKGEKWRGGVTDDTSPICSHRVAR